MTDTSSSPAPIIAFDYAQWEAERAREAEKAIQYLETNKTQLFGVLDPAGIHYVTVTFDGGGDSGDGEGDDGVAEAKEPWREVRHGTPSRFIGWRDPLAAAGVGSRITVQMPYAPDALQHTNR